MKYNNLVALAHRRLPEIGFELVLSDDAISEFKDANKWRIVFEGDQGFSAAKGIVSVVAPDGKRFAVWMIMRIFGHKMPVSGPDIIQFILKNIGEIENQVGIYSPKYDELNRLPTNGSRLTPRD